MVKPALPGTAEVNAKKESSSSNKIPFMVSFLAMQHCKPHFSEAGIQVETVFGNRDIMWQPQGFMRKQLAS